MKLALALLLSLLAPLSAFAAPAPCENQALIASLAKLRFGQTVKVLNDADGVRLELVDRTALMQVTCDTIVMPIAQDLATPERGSVTREVRGLTLGRTANGAISLDFPAKSLDAEAVSVLVLFDDSVSLVRGDRVFYARATRADGSRVETEGIGNGCGCERITAPDGKTSQRRLPR